MKALSLTQPWATLMALGEKRIETRDWPTSYRGELAICASKGFPASAREFCHDEPARGVLYAHGVHTVSIRATGPTSLPLGAVVCVVDVVACSPAKVLVPRILDAVGEGRPGPARYELSFGNYAEVDPTSGRPRYGFVTQHLRRLETPVIVEHMERGRPKLGGALGIYDLSPACEAAVRDALERAK